MPPCKLGFNEAKAAWGHWDYVDLSQFTKVPEGSIKSSALWLMKDCGTKAQNPGLLAGVASFSAGIALHRIRPWKSQSEKLPQNHGTSISTLELCDPEEKQSTSWLSTLLKTAGAGCIIGAASRKVHKYRRAYRAKAEKYPCASKMAKGLLDPLDETTGESELDEVDRKTRRSMSSGQTTEDDTAGLKPLNKSLEEESIGKVVLPIMHFKQIQYFQETSPFSSNAPTRSPSPRRKCRLPPVDEPTEDKQDQDHAGEEEKCPKVADILEEPTRKMELAEGGLAITDKQVNEGSVENPPLPTLSPSTQSFATCPVLAKVSDQQHLPRPKDLPLATPGDVQQIHPSPVPTRAKVSPRQVKTPVRVVPKAFQPPAITGVAHLERPHALQSSAVASPIGTYLPPGPPPGPLGPPGPQPGTKLPVPSFPVEATKGTTGTLLPMGSPPVPKSIDLTQRPASSPVDTSKPISPASQAAWRKNVLWASHSPYGNRAVSERPPSAAAGPAPVQPVQPKSSAATPVPSPPVSSGKELPGTGVSPRPPSGRPLATPASSGHQLNGLLKTPSRMQSQGGLPPPKAAASSSSSGPMPAQSSSSLPARSSTAGVEDEYEMYSYTGSSRSSSPERKRRSRSNSSSRSSYARSCSPNSRKRGNDFLPDISVQCTPRAETANPANPANPQSLGTNQDRQDGQGLQNEQTLQAGKGDAKETEDIKKPEST